MIVVQLLNVLLGVLLFILRDVLGLLDLADRVGARVADRHPPFFGELVHDFHQLPPPLFVERGSGMRIKLPSLEGVSPKSEARIAFSTALRSPLSHGWIVRSFGSGAATVAT